MIILYPWTLVRWTKSNCSGDLPVWRWWGKLCWKAGDRDAAWQDARSAREVNLGQMSGATTHESTKGSHQSVPGSAPQKVCPVSRRRHGALTESGHISVSLQRSHPRLHPATCSLYKPTTFQSNWTYANKTYARPIFWVVTLKPGVVNEKNHQQLRATIPSALTVSLAEGPTPFCDGL